MENPIWEKAWRMASWWCVGWADLQNELELLMSVHHAVWLVYLIMYACPIFFCKGNYIGNVQSSWQIVKKIIAVLYEGLTVTI